MSRFYEERGQPHDFYRYTQSGLRHLFATTSFQAKKRDWLEGYFGTIAQQFSTMCRQLPPQPPPGLSVLSLIFGWPGQVKLVCNPVFSRLSNCAAKFWH